MEAHSNRGEAERWLTIAEKLLTAHDLVGSKTFAIRARESDPKLDSADQILAVVDTLLAGASRINNQHDWYAVLQLVRQTHDSELIATQYRRLALLLNPEKNKLPFAEDAFKLVIDAWSVLSNPSKKSLYDNELSLHSKLDSAGSTQKQQQQQQQPVRKSLRSKDKIATEEPNERASFYPSSDESTQASFWTACPYCYNLYEYPRVYEECTLRCQNCQRAFHAVMIASPPVVDSGKDAYFCCWGFFPLGFSVSEYSGNAKDTSGSYNWVPFSPMFTCPSQPHNKVHEAVPFRNWTVAEDNVKVNANANAKVRAKPKAVIIDDDDDMLMEVSDPSEDSDDEWGSNSRKKKKAKNAKGKVSMSKNVKKFQAEKVRKGSQNVENFQGGPEMQEGNKGGMNASSSMGETSTSKKGVMSNSKKQTGKSAAKELGKLDLNVEFSNEVEEHAPGMSEGNGTGNGEEDNIEGIGFFEGLDEFLSSLPILSVVGDDKVKAA